jgi:serine/threonine-protein kinase RsbW
MVSYLWQCPVPSRALADFNSLNWRRLLARTRAEATKLVDKFTAELCAAGCTAKEIFGIRLAAEEALVNSIHHGHHDDPSKQVQVRYLIRPERVLLMIEDEGQGFNPDMVPDPLAPDNLQRLTGRGLFLMRYYMTWVHFNECGNRVMMCKER